MAPKKRPLAKRFWPKVHKGGPDECWIWHGSITRGGYGMIRDDNFVSRVVHRLSWEMHHGPIPEGLKACHRCDVPACVNPKHLFLGTQQENIDDKFRKRREARGSRTGRAKLSEKDAVEIRFIYDTGRFTQAEIAKKYCVDRLTVIRLLLGQTWSHVPNARKRLTPAEISARAHSFRAEHETL